LGEPAGLETDDVAHEEASLPVTVPAKARNGRWIAGKSSRRFTHSGVVISPPEPPDDDVSWVFGGSGGEITTPDGELRAFS
jgi:hypothetical protein